MREERKGGSEEGEEVKGGDVEGRGGKEEIKRGCRMGGRGESQGGGLQGHWVSTPELKGSLFVNGLDGMNETCVFKSI